MRLINVLLVGLSIACLRDAVSQSPKAAGKKVSTISVTLHSEHESARSGAPIILKATLVNASNHDIILGYDRRQGRFEVDVFDETGKRPPDKRLGYHNGRLDLEELARTWTPEQLMRSGLLTGIWFGLR